MPLTPDRKPGPLEEDEEIQLGPNAIGPTQAGAFNYDGSDFRFRDGAGTFNPRTGGSGITESQHKTLRQLVHLADEGGPWEGFASGAFYEILPAADPFPTSAIWWTSAAKTHKIVELAVTYNANKTPNTEQWKAYDPDGTTVLVTITDTWAYSGIFPTSRTRVIT